MEPNATPTTPAAAPTAGSAPPAAPSAPATPPAAPSSASGPGFSGVASGSGTPNPTPSVPPTPGFNAASAPANAQTPPAPAAPDFDTQFQQRYGMSPGQAQMLISMGYKTYQGQQTPPAAATQPQPQASQPQNPFGLPKFDMGLLSMVGRDPNSGQLVNLPGAPPDAAWQVQQYQEKLKEVQQGFFQDPMKYLGDQIAERVKAEAAKVYQQQFQGHQQQETVNRILTSPENAWMYATDAQGQRMEQFDPATGQMRPQLSPYGRFYAQQVQRLGQQGVTDPQTQHELATQALQNALLIQERQRTQAPAAGQAAAAGFAGAAAASPPPAPPPSYNVPPAAPGVSLRDRMRQAMESNGLSNEVVQQQLNRVA